MNHDGSVHRYSGPELQVPSDLLSFNILLIMSYWFVSPTSILFFILIPLYFGVINFSFFNASPPMSDRWQGAKEKPPQHEPGLLRGLLLDAVDPCDKLKGGACRSVALHVGLGGTVHSVEHNQAVLCSSILGDRKLKMRLTYFSTQSNDPRFTGEGNERRDRRGHRITGEWAGGETGNRITAKCVSPTSIH